LATAAVAAIAQFTSLIVAPTPDRTIAAQDTSVAATARYPDHPGEFGRLRRHLVAAGLVGSAEPTTPTPNATVAAQGAGVLTACGNIDDLGEMPDGHWAGAMYSAAIAELVVIVLAPAGEASVLQ
jgi:hypothetical protein